MTQEGIISIFPELAAISDVDLRNRCADVWIQAITESKTGDNEFSSVLCHKSLSNCPITLVQHTSGVIKLSMQIAERFIEDFSEYIPLKMDHVIAAACLHDVGKLYEHMRDESGTLLWSATHLHHPLTGAILAYRMGIPPEIVYAIANHSHEGDTEAKKGGSPLLFVLRMADENYYEYLFFGFEKKQKSGW